MAQIKTAFIADKINGITVKNTYKAHSTNYTNTTAREVNYVIIHYTGNIKDKAVNNAKYFKNNKNLGTSAHFFVDDKNIYQSIELRHVAYHAGDWDFNYSSWGIEMCTSGQYKVSAKTIKNTAHLTANLCKRLGIKAKDVDKFVLRHYDITKKQCPKQFSDGGKTDKDWVAFKAQVKEILEGAQRKTSSTVITKAVNYKVRVTADCLNIRKGAGTSYKVLDTITDKGIYTIVKQRGDWGCLKKGPVVGNSWIYLKGYTKKV